MSSRKRTIISVLILFVICGLLIWHAISWQLGGKYQETFRWLDSSKAYLVVLYNVGFMIVLGFTLGILLDKITSFSGDKNSNLKDKTRVKDED